MSRTCAQIAESLVLWDAEATEIHTKIVRNLREITELRVEIGHINDALEDPKTKMAMEQLLEKTKVEKEEAIKAYRAQENALKNSLIAIHDYRKRVYAELKAKTELNPQI